MTHSEAESERGARIRQAIERSGKSQAFVARKVGVARQTLWRWMEENVDPGDEKLIRIAAETGTTAMQLRYGSDVQRIAEEAQREARERETTPPDEGRARAYDEGVRSGVRWAVAQMRSALDRISSTGEEEGRRVVELPWHELFRPERIDLPPTGEEKKGA